MKIRRRSEAWKDVEDRRGQKAPVAAGGMNPALLKMGLPGIIIMIVLALLGGSQLTGGGGTSNSLVRDNPAEQELAEFSVNVMLDVQETWERLFSDRGETYERATYVLFEDSVATACGNATSAVGPFYCPGDQKVYMDMGFARELEKQFGVEGDFAWAYIIAHEVGHHIQYLTGVNESVRKESQQNPSRANDLSVRQELQADCLAGVWGHDAEKRDMLEAGDLEEGLLAAERVGDDWIQKNLGSGRVNPDSFTHGSSDQRQKWFNIGYESGDLTKCDTFSVANP